MSEESFNDPNIMRFAPRFDLREKAFRNYEKYIVRAYEEGSYTIDPKRERLMADRRSITARSFCIRFRDAILGFSRYGYSCSAIPKGTALTHIKAKELLNGMVRIINTQKDNTLRAGACLASDWDRVMAGVEAMCKIHREDPYAPTEDIFVYFNTEAERQKIMALDESHSVSPKLIEPGLFQIRI